MIDDEEDKRINALRVQLWREDNPEAARESNRRAQALWRTRNLKRARAESRVRTAAARARREVQR